MADESYVVFTIFERVDEGMAVDAVPIEEMERATKWGNAFASVIMQILDRLDPEVR